MTRRRFIAILGLTAAMGFSPAVAQETALRIGIAPEPFLPYSTLTSSNQWEGFEPDVMRAVCTEMKAKCSFVAIAWDGLIPSLNEKKVDIILGAFSINETRQKVVDFSLPYEREQSSIIGAKSNNAAIGTAPDKEKADATVIDPKSFSGQIIGSQASSSQAMYVQKYLASVQSKNYDTADNTVADLVAGRIDYAVLSDNYAQPFLKSSNGADYEVKASIPPNDVLGKGIGMAVYKGNENLLSRIDTALKALDTNGEMAKIKTKWFPDRTAAQ